MTLNLQFLFSAVQANICGKSLTCDQLCFAASAITGECACQDGWKFDSNSRCVVNEQAVKGKSPKSRVTTNDVTMLCNV